MFGGFEAHIDHADEGHGLAVGAFVEAEQLVFSGEGIVPGLEGGRGGAEEDGAGFEGGAEDGDVASVVAGRVFLFIGIFVFFVDEDEAEVGEGSEDGGARADHDAGESFADAVPFVEAFSLGEVRVEDGDFV